MLPDGNGEFTRKMGMLIDPSAYGMGLRSRRYSILVEDMTIAQIFIEPGCRNNPNGVPVPVSRAETIVAYFRNR